VATTGSDYEAWRADRHAAMPATHLGLRNEAVRRATGQAAGHWQRIVGGETNEVYVATLASGTDVVVRISRKGDGCRFESEQWAVHAAAAAGVPVATILGIERTHDDAGELALCIEERIEGLSLDDVPGTAERERLTGLAGEVTALLHTVEMPACGWVRPDGSAPAPSWERVLHLGADAEQLDSLCAAAVAHGMAAPWVRAAAAELERHDELLAPIRPRLLHGDLSPNHVLSDGARITGLIDLEQAFAGDPAFEFVRWDYFYASAPVGWLLAGYQRVADLGPELELRIKLGRLRLHLALVDFYGRMDHTLALAVVARRLAEDAEWFGFPAC